MSEIKLDKNPVFIIEDDKVIFGRKYLYAIETAAGIVNRLPEHVYSNEADALRVIINEKNEVIESYVKEVEDLEQRVDKLVEEIISLLSIN